MVLELILVETNGKRQNYDYVGRKIDTGAETVESPGDQKALSYSAGLQGNDSDRQLVWKTRYTANSHNARHVCP